MMLLFGAAAAALVARRRLATRDGITADRKAA
jgi:hypothetical protein